MEIRKHIIWFHIFSVCVLYNCRYMIIYLTYPICILHIYIYMIYLHMHTNQYIHVLCIYILHWSPQIFRMAKFFHTVFIDGFLLGFHFMVSLEHYPKTAGSKWDSNNDWASCMWYLIRTEKRTLGCFQFFVVETRNSVPAVITNQKFLPNDQQPCNPATPNLFTSDIVVTIRDV